ncbi:MAG: peptidylprolyl isomerase, partial [Polyangiaceae bacterium]
GTLTGLVREDFGATLAVHESMTDPGAAEKPLREFASRPPPPAPPAPVARRLSWLRCTAAKLLAGKNYKDPLLTSCELPTPADSASPASSSPRRATSIAARTIVEVLGRADLKGARLTAFRTHAEGPDHRAREAALSLLETHDEVDAAPLLAAALDSGIPGVIGTAAEVLAKHPERASADTARKRRKKDKKKDDDAPAASYGPPSPAVLKALVTLLTRKTDTPDSELDDGLIDAAAALGAKDALPRIEELCHSPYPTTRDHAEKAIALLSGKKVECPAPPEGGPLPTEMHAFATAHPTIVLQTDAGEMTLLLDTALAPVAVTRVVELARAGYYDGMLVHRVVPGFVTQFGAPWGDGYGGPEGKLPLRCETSPLPFDPLRIGVALAGRDTGSSQLFIMHARFPHLDGKYALVGTAKGPWAAFVDGDLIHHVEVR